MKPGNVKRTSTMQVLYLLPILSYKYI